MSAADRYGKAVPKPRRRAISVTIHQSGRASPGNGRNRRGREMVASELVTVPPFSPQAAAGSRTRAPAEGVGLAGERDRSHAGPADAAGRQVAIDDGAHFVGALGGLIDPLREAGDDAGGGAEQIEEARHVRRIETGGGGGGGGVRGDLARARQRRRKPARARID